MIEVCIFCMKSLSHSTRSFFFYKKMNNALCKNCSYFFRYQYFIELSVIFHDKSYKFYRSFMSFLLSKNKKEGKIIRGIILAWRWHATTVSRVTHFKADEGRPTRVARIAPSRKEYGRRNAYLSPILSTSVTRSH